MEWDKFKILLETVPKLWMRSWDSHEKEIEWWYAAVKLWRDLEIIIFQSHSDGGDAEITDLLELSFFFERLFALQQSSAWSLVAVLSGAYESSLRDLRFIIEDMVQAKYIDQVMDESKTIDKVKSIGFLEDGQFRGSTLVKKCNLPKNLSKRIIKLYRDLSGFVHPSREISQERDMEHILDFAYSESYFNDATELHRRAYDIVVTLVLLHFPKVKKSLLSETELLERLGYNLTLENLK